MIQQLDLEIFGRVQGVYYKTTIAHAAHNLGIKGYVKSLENGRVKISAQGTRDQLEEFLKASQRGSFLTKVQGLNFKFVEPKETFKKFEIKLNENLIKDKLIGLKNLGKRVVGSKDILKVPNHVVVIPDGNRRWAREKHWHPWVGHLHAVRNQGKIMEIFKEGAILGIKFFTLWGFSTENWSRDKEEINVLFNLFRKSADDFLAEFQNSNIKFRHIGRKDRIPEDVLKLIEKLESGTKDNDRMHVLFALDYGGRDELIRAFKKMKADQVEISEETISSYLDTANVPDPDLIIRTSGEKRTSGIMPWQSTYAELYFTNVLFPDFDAEQLRLAVLEYSYRTRRFGGTADEDLKNIKPEDLRTPEEKELAALAVG